MSKEEVEYQVGYVVPMNINGEVLYLTETNDEGDVKCLNCVFKNITYCPKVKHEFKTKPLCQILEQDCFQFLYPS